MLVTRIGRIQMAIMMRFRGLVRDTRGANMVEYIILVGVVALLAVAAFRIFNTAVTTRVNDQATEVGKIK